MKKSFINLVVVAIVAVASVSCLKDGYMVASYGVRNHFEVSDVFYQDYFAPNGDVCLLEGGYYSGDMIFCNKGIKGPDDKWSYTGGFMMSALADSTCYPVKDIVKDENGEDVEVDHVINPLSACAKSGADKSKIFAIFDEKEKDLMPEKDIVFLYPEFGYFTPVTAWVCNTTENVYSIKYGIEGVQEAFADGDWMRVVATGMKAGVQTDTCHFYLADFRDGKSKYNAGWSEWKLSKLGAVDCINFDIEISEGKTGLAHRFCLDDMYCNVDIKR